MVSLKKFKSMFLTSVSGLAQSSFFYCWASDNAMAGNTAKKNNINYCYGLGFNGRLRLIVLWPSVTTSIKVYLQNFQYLVHLI